MPMLMEMRKDQRGTKSRTINLHAPTSLLFMHMPVTLLQPISAGNKPEEREVNEDDKKIIGG